MGNAVFTLGGDEVYTVALYPATDVISHSLLDLLRRIGADYLRRAG